MKNILKILSIVFAILINTIGMNAQSSVDYELIYEADSCRYEVWAYVSEGNNTGFPNDSGALAVGLVVPGSYANNAVTNIESNEPGNGSWSIGSTCFADNPNNDPGTDDYYHITMGGDVFETFVDEDSILLFTFDLNLLNCAEGIRLWENTTDPISAETCLGDFDNSFQMVYAAIFESAVNGEIYNANLNNDPIVLPKPSPIPSFTCSESTLFLNANPPIPYPECLGPLTYSWSGPNDFSSMEENPTIVIEGDASFYTGLYSVSVTDKNGCLEDNSIDVNSVSCQALPVEFLLFEANKKEDEVMLTWITAVEINNDFFEIQRSIDGDNFITIGEVNGNGTTSSESHYSFIDQKPNRSNYYRLKQVDYDGNFDYSELRFVAFEKDSSSDFFAYPNPFSNRISLNLEEGIYNVKIYSVTGKLEFSSLLTAGEQINTASFNTGAYIINVENTMGIQVLNQILIKG